VVKLAVATKWFSKVICVSASPGFDSRPMQFFLFAFLEYLDMWLWCGVTLKLEKWVKVRSWRCFLDDQVHGHRPYLRSSELARIYSFRSKAFKQVVLNNRVSNKAVVGRQCMVATALHIQ
jgi:hypothetical protein